MPTPTPSEVTMQIDAMFSAKADLLANLAGRWADEHRYENINDYADVIRRGLRMEFTLVRMTKRPFGFEFTHSAVPGNLYAMTATASGRVVWKRLK